ncbi:MAG: ATP-binding protein [Pyrinomonadaceae bacterium MAG19_C2-C3]|nr:ATP-binding protein [Pyrinomonadaceae bacterium MAG19_C2-C3]
MLIQFTVGNYKSFKDNVTFSMVAANLVSQDKSLDANNTFEAGSKIKLLKSAAIYGANASGKSNLVQALKFMRAFVLNSSRETQAKDSIPVEPFRLSTETENAPSFFEVIFLLEGKKYRYGFEADGERVHSEWLFHTPANKEAKLFSREGDKFTRTAAFKEGKDIDERTRDNALFVSVVAQFNGKISQRVLGWFEDLHIVSGLKDTDSRYNTAEILEDDLLKRDVLPFIKQRDLGIEDVKIEHVPMNESKLVKNLTDDALIKLFLEKYGDTKDSIVKTVHKKFSNNGRVSSYVDFDLADNESEGTKKLFAFASSFCAARAAGHTLIIDELDARLHPLITLSIIRFFNSKESNPNNAQLIFTTHDTNLLSNKNFRRDQIWFTEKNKYGATDLYSLAEYKVRNDASYEKDYIAGRYGAIPFIGNLKILETSPDD